MVVTEIKPSISPEVVDWFIKGLILKQLQRAQVNHFCNNAIKSIVDDILDSDLSSGTLFFTLSGTCQQKLVLCFDTNSFSPSTVRTIFDSITREKFVEGECSTNMLRYHLSKNIGGKSVPVTHSFFGIISDTVEDFIYTNV